MNELEFDTLNVFNAAAIGVTDEYVRTFAVFGLWGALSDFGCGEFESDPHIRWYWKTASKWPTQQSQREFNAYARKRLADRVGHSRRTVDASTIVDRLFDKARVTSVTFEEVITAVTTLVPTEPFPFEVVTNRKTASVDLTQRADSPKVLKVNLSFLPVLKRLYPFRREDDVVVKPIPVGAASRELDLVTLAFWLRFPDAERHDRAAIRFRDGNGLNWAAGNLSSLT
jgi:hypothetical protein